MALIPFARGIAIAPQAVLGVVDPTTKALTGTVDESEGAILGDSESGEGGSGIVFTEARELREKATVSGSFTVQPSDFLSNSIETWTVAIPLKGNGGTASIPGDTGDLFKPAVGIDTMLEILGFAGELDGVTPGWVYRPATQKIASAKIWKGSGSSSQAWVIQDATCSGLVIDLTPGNVAVATFTLAGTIESYAIETFPTFDYGQQAVTSAPTVEDAAHRWGGAVDRGWTAASIAVSPLAEEIPDSNAVGGTRERQTGFEITNTMTVYRDSTIPSFEHDELVRASGLPSGPSEFTIGYPGTGSVANGDLRLGYAMSMSHPEVRSHGGEQGGPDDLAVVTMRATDTTAKTEFALQFK